MISQILSRSLCFLCALVFLSSCGEQVSSLDAKATFGRDHMFIEKTLGLQPNLQIETPFVLSDFGVGFEFDPPNAINPSKILISEEKLRQFEAENPFVLRTRHRIDYLQKAAEEVAKFLEEHNNFLKNTVLERRYDLMRQEIEKLAKSEKENERYAGEEPPEYTEEEQTKIDSTIDSLNTTLKTLGTNFEVKLEATWDEARKAYTVEFRCPAATAGSAREQGIDELGTEIKSFLTGEFLGAQKERVQKDLMSNISEAALAKIEEPGDPCVP